MKMEYFTEEQLQNLRQAFLVFDKNRDGTINKQQLKVVLEQLGINLKEEHLSDIIQKVDADGDNVISFHEFLNLMSDKFKEPESEHAFLEVFKIIDQDSDGRISKEELRAAFNAFKIEFDENDIGLLFDDGEKENRPGFITYDQYLSIMKCL